VSALVDECSVSCTFSLVYIMLSVHEVLKRIHIVKTDS